MLSFFFINPLGAKESGLQRNFCGQQSVADSIIPAIYETLPEYPVLCTGMNGY